MCAKRTDKSSEDQKGTETQSPEQLADASVEQTETATDQDATSEQGFALVLDDEINLLLEKLKSGRALLPEEEMKLNLAEQQGLISSNSNMNEPEPIAQEDVQPQTDDAQYLVHPAIDAQKPVQSAGDEVPTLEPNPVDIVEVLAVTSKSESGFYRAGIKFERLNAIPVEVLADGSGLVGEYTLTISQVQAIRDEPHLKCELVHHKVTM